MRINLTANAVYEYRVCVENGCKIRAMWKRHTTLNGVYVLDLYALYGCKNGSFL